jgi:hypothetical protein
LSGICFVRDGKERLFRGHDGFSPFGDDGVSLVHGHAGIFGEHDGATTTSPGHKINEVFFAEGRSPAGRVRQIRAAFNQATFAVHKGLVPFQNECQP